MHQYEEDYKYNSRLVVQCRYDFKSLNFKYTAKNSIFVAKQLQKIQQIIILIDIMNEEEITHPAQLY